MNSTVAPETLLMSAMSNILARRSIVSPDRIVICSCSGTMTTSDSIPISIDIEVGGEGGVAVSTHV